MSETEISADADVPCIRTVREFDAPPDKVFRAHTDPDVMVRWLGPRGTETRIDHFDCRTGGSYRWTHASESGELVFRGCFHTVRPADLIVQTSSMEGAGDGVALETLVLTALDGGRTRLTTTLLVDSFEARDAIVASGMEYGVREGFDRLDEVLAGEST